QAGPAEFAVTYASIRYFVKRHCMSRRILYLRSPRLAMMTLVAVVLAAITVLSPGSTFSGAKASVDEDVIAKSIRFRTDLGLPADRSYVIDIESQPDALRD